MSEFYACAVRTSALLFMLSVLKARFISPSFSVPPAYAPSCLFSANFILFEVGKEKSSSLQNGASEELQFSYLLLENSGHRAGKGPF